MAKVPMISRSNVSGKAKVQLRTENGKHLVGVTFESQPNHTYVFAQKDCPPYVTKGNFYVRLSQDKKTLESMSPQNGVFELKVKQFVAKEGEEPAPVVRHNEKFKNDSLRFAILADVVAPKYEGMTVYLEFPAGYFVDVPLEYKGKSGLALTLRPPKNMNKSFALISGFLKAHKFFDEDTPPVPYSDNPLPALQRFILRQVEKGCTFTVALENGFAQAIILDDEEDEDDSAPSWGDETEEEKPAKKATKVTEPVAEEGTTSWGEPEESEDFSDTEKDTEDDEESGDAPWNDVEET